MVRRNNQIKPVFAFLTNHVYSIIFCIICLYKIDTGNTNAQCDKQDQLVDKAEYQSESWQRVIKYLTANENIPISGGTQSNETEISLTLGILLGYGCILMLIGYDL